MVIGLLQVEMSLPEAHSLKDKRMVLRSLRDRILNRMNVSVAETGDQDLWQSAEMAFVTVAAHKDVVEKRLAEVSEILRGNPRHIVLHLETQLL
jgi:uncharacterized protein YlxP (DUF503 family)